ncbi:MAG: helix-turn-helix domain-containing protein [Candidatus Omnitrophica bacterium]|nr:helix-turn-helix domain-containing protein [Candidatus Omnitrophota bacterium]
MISEYLTTSQTARLFHVTRFTILNWIKQQKLQAVTTLGGHQRIPQKAIEALLKQKQQVKKTPIEPIVLKSNIEVKEIAPAVKEVAPVQVKQLRTVRPPQAKQAEISRIMRKSSYVSGKFFAAIKNEFSGILR